MSTCWAGHPGHWRCNFCGGNRRLESDNALIRSWREEQIISPKHTALFAEPLGPADTFCMEFCLEAASLQAVALLVSAFKAGVQIFHPSLP